MRWSNANQYGGANASKYVSLGAQSNSTNPVTLQLNTPATYFGFWWAAGDPNNGLSFDFNDTLLASLTTGNIVTLLSANDGAVTAVDGSTYTKAAYYGNPNNHLDPSQPFSYVNIFASGTGFNKIVFDNSGSLATGFETDNHSVKLGAAGPDPTSVFVENVSATPVTLIPEPVSLAFGGIGLLGLSLALACWRRFAGLKNS